MTATTRKPCALFLAAVAALVAVNMWVVGLYETTDGVLIRSPGGYMESWPWINALYMGLCGYYFARLSSEDPSRRVRLLRAGFGAVAVGCVLNLALPDLAGVDWFWAWHFIDAALVVTFLGQAAREWKVGAASSTDEPWERA